jgi:glycine hydroxymethyltransferase
MESRHPAMPDTGIEADHILESLVHSENLRQKEGSQLIACENYTSKGVMQLLGSALQNKYAEGYPGARYYPGNEFVDQIEVLA